TPLVDGNRVYCSHSEENVSGSAMGAIAALEVNGTGDATTVKELWKLDELVVGRSAPIVVDGRLYVVDDRCKLWVMDAATGDMMVERFAIGDRKQWPSLLYADNKIYVLTENGRWSILEITEDGVESINKGRIRNEAFYGSPIIADGRLYFQGTSALYCVGNGEGTQTPVSLAEQLVGEMPTDQNPDASQLLIVPGELLVQPGESVDLAVRLFNELGQPLAAPAAGDVKWSVEGPGQVTGSTFTAPDDADHQAATISASVGDVTGSTRVRI
ncbi:unnamed protein product, partial [Hapterophycus canaliculatus]